MKRKTKIIIFIIIFIVIISILPRNNTYEIKENNQIIDEQEEKKESKVDETEKVENVEKVEIENIQIEEKKEISSNDYCEYIDNKLNEILNDYPNYKIYSRRTRFQYYLIDILVSEENYSENIDQIYNKLLEEMKKVKIKKSGFASNSNYIISLEFNTLKETNNKKELSALWFNMNFV